MGIAGFALIGLLSGYLLHLVLPARRVARAGATALVGMAGALVGGLAGSLVAGEGLQLGPIGLLSALAGVVFAVIGLTRPGRTDDPGARRV